LERADIHEVIIRKPHPGDAAAITGLCFQLGYPTDPEGVAMRKSILVDILTVLAMIRKQYTSDRLESYIMSALSGGILDRKLLKQIESLL